MGNKFTSLSLGIIFSLSCLTGKVIAMKDMEDNTLVGGGVINEQNLGELQHCEHNDGKQLEPPGKGDKKLILTCIEHYNEKDALDCLQKLFENKQSEGAESLYSKEKNTKGVGDFRLDQPAKITTENKSPINKKGKKNKTNKYKNKRNKNFDDFDDTSTENSSTSDDSSFDETVSNEKGDVLVIINVQKKSDTYCEVIVKRDVLKYFGMLSNKNNESDSGLRSAINTIIYDTEQMWKEKCKGGRNPSKKIMESLRDNVNQCFDSLNGQQMMKLNAKLSKSPEAKTSWDNFRDETKKIDVKQAWNDLKTNLSNLLNVEDSRNEDNIDNEKLDLDNENKLIELDKRDEELKKKIEEINKSIS